MAKSIFIIFDPEFGDDHFLSYCVVDTSTGMGSTKNRDKNSKTPTKLIIFSLLLPGVIPYRMSDTVRWWSGDEP